MEDFSELLFGKKGPTSYSIKFLVSKYEQPLIVNGDDIDWLIEMNGTAWLMDVLDVKAMKNLPKEYGLYSATLFAHSYKSNNYDDPEEWDMNIWLEEVKLEIKL